MPVRENDQIPDTPIHHVSIERPVKSSVYAMNNAVRFVKSVKTLLYVVLIFVLDTKLRNAKNSPNPHMYVMDVGRRIIVSCQGSSILPNMPKMNTVVFLWIVDLELIKPQKAFRK